MRRRHIVLHPYLERSLLEQICDAAGENLPAGEEESKPAVEEDVVKEDLEESSEQY